MLNLLDEDTKLRYEEVWADLLNKRDGKAIGRMVKFLRGHISNIDHVKDAFTSASADLLKTASEQEGFTNEVLKLLVQIVVLGVLWDMMRDEHLDNTLEELFNIMRMSYGSVVIALRSQGWSI